MTARQQIARLLPLALLVILIAAGLRGAVADAALERAAEGGRRRDRPGARGHPRRAADRHPPPRDAAARRAAERRPYTGEDAEIEPSAALRFALKWLLGAGMVAVAIVLISDLHLHFLSKPRPCSCPAAPGKAKPKLPPRAGIRRRLVAAHPVGAHPLRSARGRAGGGGGDQHLVVVPAPPPGRAAGHRGRGGRGAAGGGRVRAGPRWPRSATPGPRSSPATWRWSAAWPTGAPAAPRPTPRTSCSPGRSAAGTVRGPAAGRLTALFYEARFSTHPLAAGQRAAASAALDELAAELAAAAAPASRRRSARPPAAAGHDRREPRAARAPARQPLARRDPRADHRRDPGRRRRRGGRGRVRLAGRRRRRRRGRGDRPAGAPRACPGRPPRRSRRAKDKQRARAIFGYASAGSSSPPASPAARCTSRTCARSSSTSSPPGWPRATASTSTPSRRRPAGVLPHQR